MLSKGVFKNIMHNSMTFITFNLVIVLPDWEQSLLTSSVCLVKAVSRAVTKDKEVKDQSLDRNWDSKLPDSRGNNLLQNPKIIVWFDVS